jgi:predicted PurR-regulated permease PerM
MIILGAIFAYGIRPIAAKMEDYLKFRSLSILIATILVVLPLVAVIALTINTLIEASPAIIATVKSYNLNSINGSTLQQPNIQQSMPQTISPYVTSFLNLVNVELADIFRYILNYLLGFIESIPMLSLQAFIFVCSTFYFVRDGDKAWEYIKYAIPEDRKNFFNNLFLEIDRVLKSIFYGHFVTSIILGIMAGIGFYLLGYPYPVFLGVLAGFLHLIPVIGSSPVYIILAISDVLAGNYVRAAVVLIFGLLLGACDIYIRPYLSGKYADIHPLIFLLGFLSGPLVFGLVGFILGPLILGVAYAAMVAFRNDQQMEKKVN